MANNQRYLCNTSFQRVVVRRKMKNVIVSGFYFDFLIEPIKKLENDKYINISKWVVGDDNTKVEHKNKIWWWDIVFDTKYPKTNRLLTDDELNYLLPKLNIFQQHIVREKIFEFYSLYEIQNIIYKFIYYFKDVILSKKIDTVIFSDVPHGAYDLILYYVAKMLKIDTIFFMPSFWIGKTFIYHDLEDIGKFEIVCDKKLHLEQTFQKDLPYMKEISIRDKLRNKTKIIWNFNHTINEKLYDFKKNKKIYGNLRKYFLLHIERSIKRSIEKHDYIKNYNKYFNDKIINDEKYVYFPLHLQPEMTTDTLGGIYYDQLLAIEKLRKILPNDWYIYVKENPKQTAYMRGIRFFERLSQIKNIRLLNKDINTYDIMQKCQFVATITGTAGWEAITGGKSALVFGLAWYRYMSGVSIYYDGISIDEIINKGVNFDVICNHAYLLYNKAYDFVVNDYQKNNKKDYNYNDNVLKIIEGLSKELAFYERM